MKKAITAIIIFLALAFSAYAEVQHSYEISVHYNRGNLSLNYVKVILSTEAYRNPFGKYIAETKTFDNKIANTTEFGFGTTVLYDYVDPETGQIAGGGMFEKNESPRTKVRGI